MIVLILAAAVFVSGMCVGAALLFMYMIWMPVPPRVLPNCSQDEHRLPWVEEEQRIKKGRHPYLDPDEIEQETGEGPYVPRP